MKKHYYLFALLIIIILGGAFYWYEIRPVSIKKNCYNQAEETKNNVISTTNGILMDGRLNITIPDYDKIFKDEYEKCLMENGIK